MSTAQSEPLFEGGGHRRALTIKRYPRARAFRLRVDPRDGRILLSMPHRGSAAKARKWAESQRGWIEERLAQLPRPHPIAADTTLPYRGRDIRIDWSPDHPRKPHLDEDRLRIGGPEEVIAQRTVRWFKDAARHILSAETDLYARRAGVEIARVSIGDPRSRWGSCSSVGNIRYSWRLVMAPPEVLSATVAHEVAHRVHMDHGPHFHAFVSQLFGRDPAPERAWLRDNGAALYWVGCSS